MMDAGRLPVLLLLVLCFVMFAGCAADATSTVSRREAPALPPGTARVWIIRQSDPENGNALAAAPMVFANGAAVGRSPAGTAFYHDFAPGRYAFGVEPYGGLPTGQTITVQLASGTETYLQVQWLASWQLGYPEAGWSFAPNTFGMLTMSPQLAKAYLPVLTYLGQR